MKKDHTFESVVFFYYVLVHDKNQV